MSENDLLNFQKARFVFDHMSEEVHFWRIIRDKEGKIETWRLVYANKPTLKTWGISSLQEIEGKTTDEIFGDGAAKHYLPVVEKIINEGNPHSFQDYFPNLDRHFQFTSVPMGDYFITTGWDITRLVKENQDLADDKDQLLEHIRFNEQLEREVHQRTTDLQEANAKLNANIRELKSAMEDKNQSYRKNVDKVSELLLKQADLAQNNSKVLQTLVAVQTENRQLRAKLRMD